MKSLQKPKQYIQSSSKPFFSNRSATRNDNKRPFFSPTHFLQTKEDVLQTSPVNEIKSEAFYKQQVESKDGNWCKDSALTGMLHGGQRCYREIPNHKDNPDKYPGGNQVCFDEKTGEAQKPSPDFISAVNGKDDDGTCDISFPQPFTLGGRRALGHAISDIATEDTHLTGAGFGAITGIGMGLAGSQLKFNFKGGSTLGRIATPMLTGAASSIMGYYIMPRISRWAYSQGFLPSISTSFGTSKDANLGIGFEKKDKPLPYVPVNTYLTFDFETTTDFHSTGIFQAKVGVRVDPGSQGGLFAVGKAGAGISVGDGLEGVASAQYGVGYGFNDFMDIQITHEEAIGAADTTWFTFRLSAPPRVYKGHKQ